MSVHILNISQDIEQSETEEQLFFKMYIVIA